MGWPRIEYTEEGMREGMQIESADISVDDKVRLLDALSETGLKRIVVGSFVSPKWTPQMARMDEIMQKLTPKPGVTYTALALNQRGVERAMQYSPPLTIARSSRPRLSVHVCDVFARRNTNRSQAQEIANWPKTVRTATERGATEAGIGMNAAWGSNFVGPFTEEQRMIILRRQHALWDEAGIKVTAVSLGDPMSWNMPHEVEHQLKTIRKEWPEIRHVNLHLHNARGMAPLSLYAAMRALDESFTLTCDGTIGGFGGCPYCGNGRVTNMMPTEDVVHMWEEMGIDTGTDLDKLIDCVWMLEEIVGRRLYGHVSKAGPRPKGKKLFDINLPFIETEEQARHFKLGVAAIGPNPLSPYDEPVQSPQRDAVDAALAAGADQAQIIQQVTKVLTANLDTVLAAGSAADD
jgi:hydroxymethylglutaryl-CoA lyase